MAVKELIEVKQPIVTIVPESNLGQLTRELHTRGRWLTNLYGELHGLNLDYNRGRNPRGYHKKAKEDHELARTEQLKLVKEGERLQSLTKMEINRIRRGLS